MKDLLRGVRVVVRISNMKISRRPLADRDYVKTLHQKSCRAWSTIIFPLSTNQIIGLWRCRCRCLRQILNSLFVHTTCALPNGCHGDKRPPKAFRYASCKGTWEFLLVEECFLNKMEDFPVWCPLSSSSFISLIIKITISSIVIGLKNSYFPLIHLPSCYRTVQQTNHIQSCSLNQPIAFKVVV